MDGALYTVLTINMSVYPMFIINITHELKNIEVHLDMQRCEAPGSGGVTGEMITLNHAIRCDWSHPRDKQTVV